MKIHKLPLPTIVGKSCIRNHECTTETWRPAIVYVPALVRFFIYLAHVVRWLVCFLGDDSGDDNSKHSTNAEALVITWCAE